MTPDDVSIIGQQTVLVAVKLIAPLLLSSLAVGLIIAMFQAATQINEQTLTFVPKLATLVIVLMIAGPWMLQVIIDFFQSLMHQVPVLIG